MVFQNITNAIVSCIEPEPGYKEANPAIRIGVRVLKKWEEMEYVGIISLFARI